jgi:hypothetical protein
MKKKTVIRDTYPVPVATTTRTSLGERGNYSFRDGSDDRTGSLHFGTGSKNAKPAIAMDPSNQFQEEAVVVRALVERGFLQAPDVPILNSIISFGIPETVYSMNLSRKQKTRILAKFIATLLSLLVQAKKQVTVLVDDGQWMDPESWYDATPIV